MNGEALLTVDGLTKTFVSGPLWRRRHVQAVRDVSFTVGRGETFGLVGESGSGKSTTGRLAIRLLEPTGGTVTFDGQALSSLDPAALRSRRRDFQMIFQDPYGTLNGRMTVEELLTEPFRIHRLLDPPARARRAAELLDEVGLHRGALGRYPHEFSGGQRQRIAIARAIALEPRLVVADEPVSALDVSVQAQVLNLLKDLQERRGIAYLFISHDLGVVDFMSDRIGVLYLGKLVEVGTRDQIHRDPAHPYTQALLASAPDVEAPKGTTGVAVGGEIPSAADPPPGCPYQTRCPLKLPVCEDTAPALEDHGGQGRLVACHAVGDGARSVGGSEGA